MVQKSSLIVEKLQHEPKRYTWARSRFYMLTCKKTQDDWITLGIQSYSQMMIRVSNHLLSIVFRFHYHSQKVFGSLQVNALKSSCATTCTFMIVRGSVVVWSSWRITIPWKKPNFVSSFPSTSKYIPKTWWLGMVLGGAPNAFSECVCIGFNTMLDYVTIIPSLKLT